jgi:hypothetical protein
MAPNAVAIEKLRELVANWRTRCDEWSQLGRVMASGGDSGTEFFMVAARAEKCANELEAVLNEFGATDTVVAG